MSYRVSVKNDKGQVSLADYKKLEDAVTAYAQAKASAKVAFVEIFRDGIKMGEWKRA